jgi:hypothetical protein
MEIKNINNDEIFTWLEILSIKQFNTLAKKPLNSLIKKYGIILLLLCIVLNILLCLYLLLDKVKYGDDVYFVLFILENPIPYYRVLVGERTLQVPSHEPFSYSFPQCLLNDARAHCNLDPMLLPPPCFTQEDAINFNCSSNDVGGKKPRLIELP